MKDSEKAEKLYIFIALNFEPVKFNVVCFGKRLYNSI